MSAKRLIGEVVQFIWWWAYGKWNGYCRARTFDRLEPGEPCVQILAVHVSPEGHVGPPIRFWLRNKDGIETLG